MQIKPCVPLNLLSYFRSLVHWQATNLDLHACSLNDMLFTQLVDGLVSSGPGLRNINLSENALTSAAVTDLVATVLQSDKVQLQRLNLAGNKLMQDGLCALAAAVSEHTSLEELDLSNTGADQASLQSLFYALVVRVRGMFLYCQWCQEASSVFSSD